MSPGGGHEDDDRVEGKQEDITATKEESMLWYARRDLRNVG